MPIANSALLSSKLIKNAKLKIYKGAPHGLCTTHKEQVNEDLLAFIKDDKISEVAIVNHKQTSQVTRRQFLTSASLGAGALWLAPPNL